MSITWGSTKFEGPFPINSWEPPYRAAVYSIMFKPDPSNKPSTFRIIYFGESGNLSNRGFYKSHHKYKCWIQEAGSETNLYIGLYLMPGSNEEERRKIEISLIDQYNPACNN